jgi:hypothetical protein
MRDLRHCSTLFLYPDGIESLLLTHFGLPRSQIAVWRPPANARLDFEVARTFPRFDLGSYDPPNRGFSVDYVPRIALIHPIKLGSERDLSLRPIRLVSDANEARLRDFLFAHPVLLPTTSIDAADPLPVCRELRTSVGRIDCLLLPLLVA